MGGRGASGGSAQTGAIGRDKPITVQNEKSKSGYNAWRHTVLEAIDDGKGNITIGYPTAISYDHPNKNTTVANYSLKAGIYDQMGDRTLQSHNINWNKVQSVSGQTFDIKSFIRDQGFTWDGKQKSWVRK